MKLVSLVMVSKPVARPASTSQPLCGGATVLSVAMVHSKLLAYKLGKERVL